MSDEFHQWEDRKLSQEHQDSPELFEKVTPVQVEMMSDRAIELCIYQLAKNPRAWPSRLQQLRAESRRRNQP